MGMPSVSQIIDCIGFGPYQIQVMAIICIVAILVNAGNGQIAYISTPWQRYFYISDWERSMIPFGYHALGVLPSILFGLAADQYGRLRTLKLCHIMSLFFSVTCALAPTTAWIFISQWLLGVFRSPVALFIVYVREFLPTHMKHWTSAVTTCLVFSNCAYSAVPFVINPNLWWREFILVYSVLSFLIASIMLFKLPQSPRFRVTRVDAMKANKVLTAMAARNSQYLGEMQFSVGMITVAEEKEGGKDLPERSSIFHFKKEMLLVIMSSFVAGIVSMPLNNMATELSKYKGNPCLVKNTVEISFQCSEVKYLNTNDYLEGTYATLGPVIGLSSIILLWKYVKLITIIRVFAALIPIAMIPMAACASSTFQQVNLVFMCAINITFYFTIMVYVGELLPSNCRASGTCLLLAMDRIEMGMGFVVVEKLLYINFRFVFIGLIVMSVFGFVCTLFLPELEKND